MRSRLAHRLGSLLTVLAVLSQTMLLIGHTSAMAAADPVTAAWCGTLTPQAQESIRDLYAELGLLEEAHEAHPECPSCVTGTGGGSLYSGPALVAPAPLRGIDPRLDPPLHASRDLRLPPGQGPPSVIG